MSISQEKLDSFQARMSAWVASQGILFQLKHGGSVQGARHSLIGSALSLGLRLALVLVVVALGFWWYLNKRVHSASFSEGISTGLTAGFGADELELGGVTRERGYLRISSLKASGGEASFFKPTDVETDDDVPVPGLFAKGISTKMGLLDGVVTDWDGESVDVEEMTIELRSGAESAEDGAGLFDKLFAQSETFRFSRLDVADATIRWGYSEATRGEIRNASMVAVRSGEGWALSFGNGLFSQNWIRDLRINRIEARVSPDGLEISSAELKQGDGVLSFTAEVSGPVTDPRLSGAGTFQSLSITPFLEPEVRSYLGGDISGEFTLGGSTYAQEGVQISADIEMRDASDQLELRDAFALFKAISVVDRHRSYKRVRFAEGRFRMETGAKRMVVSGIDLDANKVMKLTGDFLVRRPTEEEVNELLNLEEEGQTVGSAFEEAGLDPAQAARERQRRVPILEGAVRLGLHPESFSRSMRLDKQYPVDPDGQQRWVDVPLRGDLFKAGVDLAEEILLPNKPDTEQIVPAAIGVGTGEDQPTP